MAKKINVGNLLNAALNENIDADEALKDLKEQRENQSGKNPQNPQHSTKSTKTKRSSIGKAAQSTSKNVRDLEYFLALQNFSDRKEQFIFRLSQECFEGYETLTRAINYKLNMNLTRNDVMRKVLEDYHKNNITDLLNALNKI